MQFIYNDSFEGYENYLNRRALDSLCKHICRTKSDKAKDVARVSEQIGYTQAWWGRDEGYYTDPELNRIVQLSRIQTFIYDGFARPIRLVIDHNGNLWADNLHSTISQIICHGYDVTFSNMPVYIVDMRGGLPIIVDGHYLVDLKLGKIKGLLSVSKYRCERSSPKLTAVNYTIGEFIAENDLLWDELTLDSESYKETFVHNSNLILGSP